MKNYSYEEKIQKAEQKSNQAKQAALERGDSEAFSITAGILAYEKAVKEYTLKHIGKVDLNECQPSDIFTFIEDINKNVNVPHFSKEDADKETLRLVNDGIQKVGVYLQDKKASGYGVEEISALKEIVKIARQIHKNSGGAKKEIQQLTGIVTSLEHDIAALETEDKRNQKKKQKDTTLESTKKEEAKNPQDEIGLEDIRLVQEYAKANKIKYDFSILKDLLPQAKAWAEERTKKEEVQDLQTKTEKKHERRAFKQEVLNRPEKQETPKANETTHPAQAEEVVTVNRIITSYVTESLDNKLDALMQRDDWKREEKELAVNGLKRSHASAMLKHPGFRLNQIDNSDLLKLGNNFGLGRAWSSAPGIEPPEMNHNLYDTQRNQLLAECLGRLAKVNDAKTPEELNSINNICEMLERLPKNSLTADQHNAIAAGRTALNLMQQSQAFAEREENNQAAAEAETPAENIVFENMTEEEAARFAEQHDGNRQQQEAADTSSGSDEHIDTQPMREDNQTTTENEPVTISQRELTRAEKLAIELGNCCEKHNIICKADETEPKQYNLYDSQQNADNNIVNGKVTISGANSVDVDSEEFKHFVLVAKSARAAGYKALSIGPLDLNNAEDRKFAANMVLAAAVEGVPLRDAPDLKLLEDVNPKIKLLREKREMAAEVSAARKALLQAQNSGEQQKIIEAEISFQSAMEKALQHNIEHGSIDAEKSSTKEERLSRLKKIMEDKNKPRETVNEKGEKTTETQEAFEKRTSNVSVAALRNLKIENFK